MDANSDELKRQLFIGGLNFQTTKKSLRDFFEQWGEVEAAVVKKYPHTQLSRGFGFITYSRFYMVELAMSNTPHIIDGRKVEVKPALPHSRKHIRQLFIGDLHSKTTYESLKEFFQQWGEVEAAIVKRCHQTNRSRGFGFITYSQSYMVDQAMSNTPHKIDGREVETKLATPRSVNELNIKVDRNKVFVSGINKQSEHDLYLYFRQFGNITSIKIVRDKYTGDIKGFGFIKYDVQTSVDKALSIRSHLVAGERLCIKKALCRRIYVHDIQRSHGYVGGFHHFGNNNNLCLPKGGFYNNINIFY
ncbi:heterogeneous nuclear ribonucleoprotein A3 homolog 1-like [Rhopalosiphum maidis]|uniref:heterogeneous nuclear ribonucleoprotein A3 homolog 1-like n=1 Tax=Rhopalosiphum maidis TaxID=43146 RepID=UPI000F00E83E|nr:heterogeneous nuclear ribonucleoprotein A3 homolog 1-like [Rhopalosiphum maidis]